MLIDLNLLNIKDEIKIDEEVTFPKEDLDKAKILDMEKVKVTGKIIPDLDDYQIDINIKGKMILPCSLTLEEIEYPFDINVIENLSEIDENYKKSEKTIDILPIIWENILMEIPMKVISPKAKDMKTKGDGWELITDSKEKGNNSLAKLKDLL